MNLFNLAQIVAIILMSAAYLVVFAVDGPKSACFVIVGYACVWIPFAVWTFAGRP